MCTGFDYFVKLLLTVEGVNIMGDTLLDEPICSVHDWCQDKLCEALECLNPEQNYIAGIIQDVICAISIAKEKGQKMEDRLTEYREAIETLGFGRVRN
jgi:hypothetical protein